MYGITALIESHIDELHAVEVSGHPAAFEGNRIIGLPDMQARGIVFGIDRNRSNTKLCRGTRHPDGDLAPICHQ